VPGSQSVGLNLIDIEPIVAPQLLITPQPEHFEDGHVYPLAANPAAHGIVENHQAGKVFLSETRSTEVSGIAILAMNWHIALQDWAIVEKNCYSWV
jgi:hypothetical protein